MPLSAPFDLLRELYADMQMIELFSEEAAIESWMRVEAALAQAQAGLGIIDHDRAAAIAEVCASPGNIDAQALWADARNVGYPILGLVRQIDVALPEHLRGSVHFGATTQDIMDSGMALQLDAAMRLAERRLCELGDALADLAQHEALTVMPARTHGQQAVPTTLGAKLGVYVDEVRRHRIRLLACRDDVRRISAFGAGGNSAALGDQASEIRSRMAKSLGLVDATVPWHVARDALVHLVSVLVGASTTAARLAREVIDLARTEIGELSEAVGHHRGASSTMPQKANPITSEAIIGFAIAARTGVAGLSRAAEAGHERSAGEWQVEWVLLPATVVDVSSALRLAHQLVTTMGVDRDRMRQNLHADSGLIMSEAAMMALAPHLGRENAHDTVYALARQARDKDTSFSVVVEAWLRTRPDLPPVDVPTDIRATGQAADVCRAAVAQWVTALTDIPSPWRQAW